MAEDTPPPEVTGTDDEARKGNLLKTGIGIGVGSAALGLFEQWCIDGGAVAVDVSWTEGPGSPAGWFSARGYEPAGTSDHGVVLATKQLA